MQLDLLQDPCTKHGHNALSIGAYHHGHKETDRATVLTLIRAQGGAGMTLDEVSAALGRPPNALSGRICELRRQAAIRRSEATRKTRAGARAQVYVATEQG